VFVVTGGDDAILGRRNQNHVPDACADTRRDQTCDEPVSERVHCRLTGQIVGCLIAAVTRLPADGWPMGNSGAVTAESMFPAKTSELAGVRAHVVVPESCDSDERYQER
jgi:hypothetical protein